MTPQEQRLVMELHSKWGNRWSRIARKLPGRTDNEIKNYWRTHMRKKRAQEKKHATASSSASSSCCQSSSYSSNNNNNHAVDSHASKEAGEYDYDTADQLNMIDQDIEQGYSMDDIWKDIALSEDNINLQQPVYDNCFCPLMPSPSTSWDYSLDPSWVMCEQESNMLFLSCYDQQGGAFLTG